MMEPPLDERVALLDARMPPGPRPKAEQFAVRKRDNSSDGFGQDGSIMAAPPAAASATAAAAAAAATAAKLPTGDASTTSSGTFTPQVADRGSTPSTKVSKKRKGEFGKGSPSPSRVPTKSPSPSRSARDFFSPPGAGHLAAGAAALQAQERVLQSTATKHEQQAAEMSRQAEEMRTLRRVNESLQASERSARAEAEKLTKEVQQLQPRLDRARDAMQAMLIEACRREKLEKEELLQRECHEIGTVVAQRHGHTVSEMWEEGAAFRSLEARRKQAADERRAVEERKKQVTAQRKKAANALKVAAAKSDSLGGQPMAPPSAPAFSAHAVHDFGEEVDICTMRLKECKEKEAALDTEQAELDRRKRLHIRELKRQRDERQSTFCNMTLGNDGQYMLLGLLGKGGFSEVFKAFDFVNCRYVACKIHQLHSSWGEEKKANYIKHATREYNIQRTLHHPRLVGLQDVFEIDVNGFCTVLEYSDGTDLDQILKEQKILSEKNARSIVSQVFSGLRYLNEQKPAIIHYDLKPANILYSNGTVKITDFGLSKLVEESDGHDSIELTSQGAGTYWYLPPECFATGGAMPPRISSKVDVWSAGVIFYQMLYGKKPFGEDQSQEMILTQQTILKASLQFPAEPKVSTESKEFIGRCLARDPRNRPSVMQVFDDPFFVTN